MTYDWQATLATLAFIIGVTVVGKFLIFRIPALRQAREYNLAEDAKKLALTKYPPMVKSTQWIGMGINVVFFLGVAPFLLTLTPQPWWRMLLDVVAVLMIYDFFYYLTHRFLFHGKSFMRQVHAVHHQARSITHIDGFYVHPIETLIGVGLFVITITGWAAIMGDIHMLAAGVCYVVFYQINTINHTHVDLPYFPFKTLSWITAKHAVHHQNMHKGNYATVTLLYDRLFGTLE